MEDFQGQVDNYGLLLLKENLNEADRRVFDKIAETEDREVSRQELRAMLEKYQIHEQLRKRLQLRLSELVTNVHQSILDDHQKTILIGWLESSLLTVLPPPAADSLNVRSNIRAFIDSANHLCYSIIEWQHGEQLTERAEG